MKPKQNNPADPTKSLKIDCCQTPDYGVAPLLPYLRDYFLIWEPAAGNGNISDFLQRNDKFVQSTDILRGENFFEIDPGGWECIVTNPPYSIKYKWIERCYNLEKPFALLMPLETLGAATAQKMFEKYSMELIVLDKRVNFIMPNKGNAGTAQFPVAWFTHGLNIGKQITYAKIDRLGER